MPSSASERAASQREGGKRRTEVVRKPIAIYTRMSLDRDGTSPGLERQQAACESLIENRGLEVGRVFRESDVSAYKLGTSRPQFDEMMAGIVGGQSLVRAFGHQKSAPLGVIFNFR